MQLRLFHLDDGLRHQQDFLTACRAADGREFALEERAQAVRLWGREADLKLLDEALPANDNGAMLTFMGSGDFHHVTALLLARLSERQAKPFTVIHFDNHPDWVRFHGGMHCGSWVNRALALPNVAKVITIGVCSKDLVWPEMKGANLAALKEGRLELFPFDHAPSRVLKQYGEGASYTQQKGELHWQCMAKSRDVEFFSMLLKRITTENIYITIDKDVLHEDEVITNWDQGGMRLQQMLVTIALLGEKSRIIGADVIGDYSTPVHVGNPWIKFKKHVEMHIDHPRRAVTVESVAAGNARSNLALLSWFREIMA